MNDSLGDLLRQNLRYTRFGKLFHKLQRDEVIEKDAMQSWCHGELMPIMNTDGKTIGDKPSSFNDERDFYNPIRCGKCNTHLEIKDSKECCPKCDNNIIEGEESMTTSTRIKSVEEMMLEIIITDEGSTFTLVEMADSLNEEFNESVSTANIRMKFILMEQNDIVTISNVGRKVYYTLTSQNKAAARLEELSLGIGQCCLDSRIKGKFSNDDLKICCDILRDVESSVSPVPVLTLIAMHQHCHKHNTRDFISKDIASLVDNVNSKTVYGQLSRFLKCGLMTAVPRETGKGLVYTLLGDVYGFSNNIEEVSYLKPPAKPAVEQSHDTEVDSLTIANQLVDLVNSHRQRDLDNEKIIRELEYKLSRVHPKISDYQQTIINQKEEIIKLKTTRVSNEEMEQKFKVLKQGYEGKRKELIEKIDNLVRGNNSLRTDLDQQKQINAQLRETNKKISDKLKWKLENIPGSKTIRLGL